MVSFKQRARIIAVVTTVCLHLAIKWRAHEMAERPKGYGMTAELQEKVRHSFDVVQINGDKY